MEDDDVIFIKGRPADPDVTTRPVYYPGFKIPLVFAVKVALVQNIAVLGLIYMATGASATALAIIFLVNVIVGLVLWTEHNRPHEKF